MKRILYLQYSTPAAYPPLIHSARLLAGRGWQVELLGSPIAGVDQLRFPTHPQIQLEWTPIQPAGRLRRKLHYLDYLRRAKAMARQFHPQWVYLSDWTAAPLGPWFKRNGFRVLYHEHDCPHPGRGLFQSWLRRKRRETIQGADIVVAPNQDRLDLLLRGVSRTGPSLKVWNCPLKDDLPAELQPAEQGDPFLLYYHGTLVEERLPFGLLDVLVAFPTAQLTLVGYVPEGAQGFQREFQKRAEEKGVADRTHWLGSRSHGELARLGGQANVGIAFVPAEPGDTNLATLPGASNKLFDYMALGLWALATDRPEWRRAFGDLVLYVDPLKPESMVTRLRELNDDPARARSMRQRAFDRIREDWNYEHQFQPVLDILEGTG